MHAPEARAPRSRRLRRRQRGKLPRLYPVEDTKAAPHRVALPLHRRRRMNVRTLQRIALVAATLALGCSKSNDGGADHGPGDMSTHGVGGVGNGGSGGGSGGAGGSGGSGEPGPDMTVTGTFGSCGTNGGRNYIKAYKSDYSVWCIEESQWTDHQADYRRFFAYGDSVIITLEQLFDFTPKGLPFYFEVTEPTGGASTGNDFNDLGDTVTGDAFYSDFQDPMSGKNVRGFWGYLLALHEAINVWTGSVASNWPTDWWADHRSPFPNSMDYHIMQAIGNAQHDDNLIAAADAQHHRMGVKGAGEYDPEVEMFDGLFTQFGGFPALANTFKLIQADGFDDWASVSPNPSPLLSEYVMAYLHLGLGAKSDMVQSTFVQAGVGKLDGSIPAYSVDAKAVGDIADAHCSIAAARKDSSVPAATINGAVGNLRAGKYAQAKVKSKACGSASDCFDGCGCDGATKQCVARWRAP
jgi:hypothetical protein